MSRADERLALDVVARTLGLTFAPGQLELPGWGKADCYCLPGDGLCVILEAERGQKHPSTNVAKLWPWLEEDASRRVILIQAFLKPNRIPKNRRDLALWLARRMERDLAGRFSYFPINISDGQISEGLAALQAGLANTARPRSLAQRARSSADRAR